ncbi:hypothetical protein M9H77_21242 [Catharanthus roseus]|uniref:Uncharacterized protein n=1 Tax=Catharanthus roseus TaxID=4058 RepID=A0ACC0AP37_CATRO|nr:hypothetical protein M9H77_21242 [Catharanthus roseus]
MSSEELVLKLFEFFWFEHGIFSRASPPLTAGVSAVVDVDEEIERPATAAAKLSRTPTLIVRSLSDQALSSKNQESSYDCSSPNSVLAMPKLQPILSGKEIGEFSEVTEENDRRQRRRRRRRRDMSRSLSELEYEEVKGFMDLGFVFSDEDKESRLVSIIPGLQRLGKKEEQNCAGDELEIKKDVFDDECIISRPYLSEAWEFLENKKSYENPLRNWRIPAFGNEMELKHHLKFWAHTVASTVK